MNGQVAKENYSMKKIVCLSVFFILTTITIILLIGMFLLGWYSYPPDQIGVYSNYGGVGIQKLRITAALILASLFVWFPNKFSKKFRLIPLLWIIFEYILWWVNSFSFFVNANEEVFSKSPKLLFLIKATWWDVVVLVVVLASSVCLILDKRHKNNSALNVI
jgi:hypothetical protein